MPAVAVAFGPYINVDMFLNERTFMLGEVIMLIPGEEMKRAAQIYVDTVFRVPVEVTDVKQKRTKSNKKLQFEIKLKEAVPTYSLDTDTGKVIPQKTGIAIDGVAVADQIDKANAKSSEEATQIMGVDMGNGEDKTTIHKRQKTLEEIRDAGSTADSQS